MKTLLLSFLLMVSFVGHANDGLLLSEVEQSVRLQVVAPGVAELVYCAGDMCTRVEDSPRYSIDAIANKKIGETFKAVTASTVTGAVALLGAGGGALLGVSVILSTANAWVIPAGALAGVVVAGGISFAISRPVAQWQKAGIAKGAEEGMSDFYEIKRFKAGTSKKSVERFIKRMSRFLDSAALI